MATPAEKKALLFLAAVAVLGGGVRLWRTSSASGQRIEAHVRHHARHEDGEGGHLGTPPRSRSASSARKVAPKPATSPITRSRKKTSAVDPDLLVDLDMASREEVEALDPIAPGIAELILSNRDSLGPFGSLHALERVPYVTKTIIRKLAPYVTFSRLPRPTNAVLGGRDAGADSAPSARQKASTAPRRKSRKTLRKTRSTSNPRSTSGTARTASSNGSHDGSYHGLPRDPITSFSSFPRPVVVMSTTITPVTNAVERLGEQLVQDGLLTRDQLAHALAEQRAQGGRIGYHLVRLGYIDELILARRLAKQYKVPAVDLSRSELDPALVKLVPSDIAVQHLVLPLKREGRLLYVAMADPANLRVIDDLKFRTRSDIFPVIAGEFTLRNMIEQIHPPTKDDEPDPVTSEAMDSLLSEIKFDESDIEMVEEEQDDMTAAALSVAVNEAPVVKLINAILTDAVQKKASDVHFECFERELRVRYRIDGALREIMRPPFKLKAALISRFKIMAGLNIAERRVPQDGRIKLKFGKRVIDYRVSTLPTLFGEKVVLRILDKGNLTLDLEQFGIEPRAERELMEAVQSPYGMVLVTGPTGSGKTTTLYSALSKINNIDVNIMTAEDPVEYNLFGINQVQVRSEIGMTFAAALRAFLRQDPNIIMVGEIRDLETGDIAIKAALTGHLVLSTLHTNSAPETVTRLLDMGLEPFNVSSALNLVVAQRLVRRVCPVCKTRYVPDDDELAVAKVTAHTTLRALRFTDRALADAKQRASAEAAPHLHGLSLDTTIGELPFFKGKGCDACNGTGLRGRQGIYEVMYVTPELRRMILRKHGADELKETAIQSGMLTLRMDGWLKVLKGIVPLEQIVRETSA